MSNNVFLPHEAVAVAAAIDPQLVDNAAVTSDWVSLANFHQVMFVLNIGATDITVDAKLQSADDSSGTNAADLTGLAVTQIAATDDNTQYVLVVRADQVNPINAGDTHVALVVTVGDGTAGAYVSAVGLGFNAAHLPANELDVASVDEIVNI